MTTLPSTQPPESPECELAFERMPWMINGSLAPPEALELEQHVAKCPRCQARLDAERDLFRAIRRPLDNVEHSPLVAWGRFEAALARESATDRSEPQAANDAQLPTSAPEHRSPAPLPTPQSATGRASARRRLRLTLMMQAASIAVLSIAVLWLLVSRSGQQTADYRTVSAADPAISPAVYGWRVAFDAATTAAAARELLARHGLRVLDGPTADNVYTVAPQSGPPAGDPAGSVEAPVALRADPRVRLLEPLGAAGAAP